MSDREPINDGLALAMMRTLWSHAYPRAIFDEYDEGYKAPFVRGMRAVIDALKTEGIHP